MKNLKLIQDSNRRAGNIKDKMKEDVGIKSLSIHVYAVSWSLTHSLRVQISCPVPYERNR